IFISAPLALPPWFVLATSAIDSAKALFAASILRRFANPVRLETWREVTTFSVFIVLLIPAISAVFGAGARHLLGHAYWTAWQQWFMGNALVHIVVTPALFYWLLRTKWKLPSPDPRRLAEGLLLAVGLIATEYF